MEQAKASSGTKRDFASARWQKSICLLVSLVKYAASFESQKGGGSYLSRNTSTADSNRAAGKF
jgi:hypothetical protein